MKTFFGMVFCFTMMLPLAQADFVLVDYFSDGVLGTSTGLGVGDDPDELAGGFHEISNEAAHDGSVTEFGNLATIVNGATPNIYGMLSNNSFDFSSATVTSWKIASYELGHANNMAMVWQSSNSFAAAPELSLLGHFGNSGAGVQFKAGDDLIGSIDLNFATNDVDGYEIEAIFAETGYEIRGLGMDVHNQPVNTNILFSGTWTGDGIVNTKTFNQLFAEEMRVGTLVNGTGTGNTAFAVDYVTIDNIPEPAVFGLISMCGFGILISRRIFNV